MQHEVYISTDRRFYLVKGSNVNDRQLKMDIGEDMWKINIAGNEDAKKHNYIVPWFLEIVKRSIEENVNVSVKVLDPSISNIGMLGKQIIYIIPEVKLNYGFESPQNNGSTTILTGNAEKQSNHEKFTMISGYVGDNNSRSIIRKEEMGLREISTEIISELMNSRKMENLKY